MTPAPRSNSDLAVVRTQSSPFVLQNLNWASKLTADAENLAASISMASAVGVARAAEHAKPAAAPQQDGQQLHLQAAEQQQAPARQLTPPPPVRRSTSSMKRRQGASTPSTPRLTTHTSNALKALPNPLEQALSEELANPDMPILFLHGVGGLPAYLEMLLQVGARQPEGGVVRGCAALIASSAHVAGHHPCFSPPP
jgi:hypothetical protein